MRVSEIFTIVVSSVLGGAGIVGIVFYFIRRYLERLLDQRDAEEQKHKENKIRRASYNDALQHAQGSLLFWLYHAVTKGELEQAFESFQSVEQKIKDHDRKIIAEQESE